jgi:hypothetical protein
MSPDYFELSHPSGVSIVKGLTSSQLLAAIPEVASSKSDMGTGWVWYRLPPFYDGEVVVVVSLAFNNDNLEVINLADTHARFGKSWADWSEEKARLRAISIGAWLNSKGFTARTYPWGSVWVGYDAKSASGSAVVRFTA